MVAPVDDDDEVLVHRARAGEQVAFASLLRRHDAALRRLAWHLLRDRHLMDDVLQQAYLKAFLGLRSFRQGASVKAWLSKITWNACIDELRRAHRREVASGDGPPESRLAQRGPAGVVGDRMVLDAALSRLPLEQRAVVLLVDAEGYGYKDAAAVLGVAPGTVASRLSRARAALRSSLADGEAELG